MHGDGHKWRKDNPFANAPKVIRVQLTQGGKKDPLLVTVILDLQQSFTLKRQLIERK